MFVLSYTSCLTFHHTDSTTQSHSPPHPSPPHPILSHPILHHPALPRRILSFPVLSPPLYPVQALPIAPRPSPVPCQPIPPRPGLPHAIACHPFRPFPSRAVHLPSCPCSPVVVPFLFTPCPVSSNPAPLLSIAAQPILCHTNSNPLPKHNSFCSRAGFPLTLNQIAISKIVNSLSKSAWVAH